MSSRCARWRDGGSKRKKKPLRPSKPSRPRRSDIYKRCEAEWESRRRDKGGDWLIAEPGLEVKARPFLATLKRLGYVTQDQRIFELYSALVASDLVDHKSGRWASGLDISRTPTPK